MLLEIEWSSSSNASHPGVLLRRLETLPQSTSRQDILIRIHCGMKLSVHVRYSSPRIAALFTSRAADIQHGSASGKVLK